MYETENQFEGIRGFLWLAVGLLLLAAAIGSAIYIVGHLLKYLRAAQFGRNFSDNEQVQGSKPSNSFPF